MEELDSNQRLDADRVRRMSTAQLVRTAIEEARLLARAEVLHAKVELKQEVARAKLSGILFGMALPLALCGLALLFVALALVLPLSAPLAALLIGAVLLLVAGALAYVGVKKLPKKPLQRTQLRLKEDVSLTREQLA